MYDSLPLYQTFIMKFWQERSESGKKKVMRFSLEDPVSHVRYGFGTFEEMVQFLKQQCDVKDKKNMEFD
mgnify:CR=1 FL=1